MYRLTACFSFNDLHSYCFLGPYGSYIADLGLLQYVLNPGYSVAPPLVLPVELQLDRPPPVFTHFPALLGAQLGSHKYNG